MKSFGEYLADKEVLDEGVFRMTAISSFATKSRGHGNEAEQSYKRGLQQLSLPRPDISAEHRFDRLDAALSEILRGLIKTRHQIGSGVAVDAAGHLMTAKALEAKSKKRQR
jgi:hypothetical protein